MFPESTFSPSFTLRTVIMPDKLNGEGRAPIKIRVTIKGRHAYITTGLRVLPDQWKEGRVQGHPNSALYNSRIAKKYNELEALLLREAPASVGMVKGLIGGKENSGSFIEYAEQVLPKLRNEKTGKPIEYETKRRWNYDLAHIRNYAPKLQLGEITPQWLRSFNKYLLQLRYPPKPGEVLGALRMEQNSARKVFVFIRRIFNEALKDEAVSFYPFKRSPEERDKFTIPAEIDKPTSYLTLEETDRIKALLIEREDLTPSMRCIISHFLLECYSGIRWSDWSKWQSERLHGDMFYLRTTKNKERISIPLEEWPRLRWIIAYIRSNGLAFRYSIQHTNDILKIVALLARINKRMTSHLARHSAATQLSAQGFSTSEVAAVLGISEKIAAKYAKLTGEKIRLASARHGGL